MAPIPASKAQEEKKKYDFLVIGGGASLVPCLAYLLRVVIVRS
jgi:hypothetical protein